MPALLFTLIYLLLSVLVGFVGRSRRLRFVGTFALSILFTPVAVFAVLYLTEPVRQARSKTP
jgi:hypothetical protein